MRHLVRCLRYLRPYWHLAALSVLFVFLASALSLLAPWPLQVLIDNVLGGKPLPGWMGDVLGPLGGARGKLLLVHGTGDDNVHYQHVDRLVHELVKHGKLFEMLAYPNRTHAIAEGPGTRAHVYASLADFLQRRVPAGPRDPTPSGGGK